MRASALVRRTIVAAIFAMGFISPASAQVARGSLDGDWAGALQNVPGPGVAAPPDGEFPEMRLRINQRNVQVWMGDEEVKPGVFEIKREGTNAVISAIQSDPGAPEGQSWVETWTFIVTLADPQTLAVNYVRVVNNNSLSPSEAGAHFSQIRTGQFRRVTQ